MRTTILPFAAALVLAACSDSRHVHLATASVGPAGGSLEIAAGGLAGLVLQVPANALGGTVQLTADDVVTAALPGFWTIGPAVSLGPDVVFGAPAVLTLPYVDEAHGGGEIVVLRRDGSGRVVELPAEPPAPSAALVSVRVASLGTFWVAERMFTGVATADYLPLDDGNVWQLGDLTIAVDTVNDEPNLTGTTVSRLTLAVSGREAGLYLQRDFLTNATDSLGWFERRPGVDLQLVHDATPLLGAAITLRQPFEHLFVFDGFAPFGATASTFAGLGATSARADAVDAVETAVRVTVGGREQPLVCQDVVRFEFELGWRDQQGRTFGRTFAVTCARFVGPVLVELDGAVHLLDSGVVAGTPIGS